MHQVRSCDIAHVNQPASSSTLFTTTTTGFPRHPLPPAPLPPHHHLHDMSKHGYDGRNMPATTPHVIATHQRHKPTTIGQKHVGCGRRQSRGHKGREGSTQRTKGGGVQGTPAIFIFLITFTNFCFSQTGPPLPNIKNMPEWVCFGVWWPLPPLGHVADAHEGVCYVSF